METKKEFTKSELFEKFKRFINSSGDEKLQQYRDIGLFFEFLETPEMFGEKIKD